MLILAAYLLSKGDSYSLYSADAEWLRRIHETVGVLVFVVVVMQLFWRLVDEPPTKRSMSRWTALIAKFVRLALYALLVSIPATAVLGTWLEGIPITLIGGDIAPMVARAWIYGQPIMEMHTTLGNAIFWAAGAHAAAALFHHFYLRDQVLRSMIPGGRINNPR